MPERIVKTTLVIDDRGSVKVVKGVGEESQRTEGKLKGLDKGVKDVGKSFGGLKSAIGVGLGAIGVGGLAFGLADIANKTKSVAEETEKFHSITGIGINSSLAYTQALKARGLSGEAVTKAFGFLAKNIKSAELQENKYAQTQATATAKGKVATAVLGRQVQALKELGINLQSFNTLSEQQKLEKITKSFEALAPGMQKTRLERELFGRGGNQLSTVLEKNNLGLTHQIDLVKKFFPTIKGGANAMQELLEKQAESKMAWEGLEFTLGQKLVPVMIEVMSWFSKTVQEVEHGNGTWGELRHTFEGVVAFLKPLWEGFSKLVGPANALATVLVGFTVLKVSSFAGLKAGLEGAFGPLIAAAFAAASIQKSLQVKKPSQAPSRGLASDVGGFLTGGLIGNPATSPLNVARAAVEDLSGGHRGALAGVSGGTHAEAPIKAELHVDSTKVAERLIQNPRARRLLAEGGAVYANGMAAHR